MRGWAWKTLRSICVTGLMSGALRDSESEINFWTQAVEPLPMGFGTLVRPFHSRAS
jgi:hypothetical protein